jgi:hypothetical protein
VPEAPPPAGLVLGRADEVADGWPPPGVARGLVVPAVAAALGNTEPLAGEDARDAPVGPDDGTRPVVAPPVAEFPAGVWFAAGAPPNAPVANSATSPALTSRAAPAPPCW